VKKRRVKYNGDYGSILGKGKQNHRRKIGKVR
jgi:hypothetical protein